MHRSADVYWTNTDDIDGRSGTVMKSTVGGGTPVVLASGQSKPSAVAVDAQNVYWMTIDASTNIGAIMKLPLDGGSACHACVGALDGKPASPAAPAPSPSAPSHDSGAGGSSGATGVADGSAAGGVNGK